MATPKFTHIARSRYRRVRLTYTEEASGRVSYSIYAKPLNADWREEHCLVRDSLDPGHPVASIEDVFRRLAAVIEEQFLPPIAR